MIFYEDEVRKRYEKKKLPAEIFARFNNAFESLDLTNDLSLFDIRHLKTAKSEERKYYRLRKGNYRAIFFVESNDFYVIAIGKREEVYKKWR